MSQAAPDPAPAQPAEDTRAPAREEAPEPPAEQPAPEQPVENVAALVGALTEVADAPEAPAAPSPNELPRADAVGVELPSVEIPADEPEPPPAPVAPAGNVNVSIRILSPGDDGPVTQVIGGGGNGPPASVAAPTTWTWNWNWIGAPGCDPGELGPVAPQLGVAGWTWNWTWTCDGGGSLSPVGTPPIVIAIPRTDIPGLEALPGIDALPGIEELPDLDILDTSARTPDKPAADAPESRAGRARSGGTSPLVPRGGSAVWAQPPSAGLAPALAPAAPAKPAAKRAAKRPHGRDTTRAGRLIPALSSLLTPSAAVASAAGAGGGGGAPAVLTPLTILVLSLLAGVLIAGVGLPRLKRRAARLERPG